MPAMRRIDLSPNGRWASSTTMFATGPGTTSAGLDRVHLIPLLDRPPRCRERLLEHDDLARMVEVMLGCAAELHVRRVLRAQRLRKPVIGKRAHGALELLIQLLQGVLVLAP